MSAKMFFDVPEAEEELARMISDGVLAFMKMHEERDHGNLPCWDERCNFIAFLCHRTGIKPDQVPFITERLTEYQKHHNEVHLAREAPSKHGGN